MDKNRWRKIPNMADPDMHYGIEPYVLEMKFPNSKRLGRRRAFFLAFCYFSFIFNQPHRIKTV